MTPKRSTYLLSQRKTTNRVAQLNNLMKELKIKR